jgi:putative transposase
MPREARIIAANACYHIITRGNQQQFVFSEPTDYEKYLALLAKCKDRYEFQLYSFCLMPNHVHLVIRVKNPLKLNKIMRSLSISYAQYFNLKYSKVGHLWQDRFKSKIIEKDAYLLECINYIEANPVRASLVTNINAYPWSSYNFRGAKNNFLDGLFSI